MKDFVLSSRSEAVEVNEHIDTMRVDLSRQLHVCQIEDLGACQFEKRRGKGKRKQEGGLTSTKCSHSSDIFLRYIEPSLGEVA